MAESIDHEARRVADNAALAMQGHEKLCAERWEQSRKAADSLVESVTKGFEKASGTASRLHERIDKLIWAVGGQIILLLLGVVGWLIVKVWP